MTVVTARTSTQTYSTKGTTDRRAMAIATALFFMWGFLTCLNDILIPHLKSIFSLSYAHAMLVQFAFFSAYFLFALPAGKLVERSGSATSRRWSSACWSWPPEHCSSCPPPQ